MKTIGNIIWFVLSGLWLGISYLLAGLIACVTIIGIPFGIQAFKMASYVMWPFGRTLHESPGHRFSKGVMNVIWIVVGGLWLAIEHVLLGAILCVTIIGIPFGIKNFSMAKLALFPFDYSVGPTSDRGAAESGPVVET
ncbi:MAG TPA: YccF domain-containing protein [Microthrixaceae bacterium]|nr:YccF domain-containing protein [Microthrixaceae bacterium]HMV75248.1 YccF domain-containing protein [Microthrixaceae bacterium]HMX08278.1 YccF domain-containing protein [Microthrixaceae bacterium]HNB95458.1 YccF domain-containing protein [Microthrixaceae bacterium]HNH39109.1 YccF domain-containing protein [Microthrixaceae bacterium]